jgi:deoxyribonuclease V
VRVTRDDAELSWDLTPKEAVQLQKQLASQVVLKPLPRRFTVLGAADLAYLKTSNELIAVVLTFRWPSLEPLETVDVREPVRFPYVPGLLSFRELPALLNAYRLLETPPEVFVCDGQGLAHPRKFGIACHLGVVLDLPTVGCAKSRLCGEYKPFELKRGRHRPLRLQGETVGSVLCSRTGVKPIYISPGHLADLPSARKLIAACLGRYRVPEPLRQAHNTATRLRRQRLEEIEQMRGAKDRETP